MSTIRKIEETIYKNVFKYDDSTLEWLDYNQFDKYYDLIAMVQTMQRAKRMEEKLQKYLDKTSLSTFFEVNSGRMNSDYEDAPAVCLSFKGNKYSNQISEIIRICCKILNIKCQDKVLQGTLILVDHKDIDDECMVKDDLAFVEDYNEEENSCKIRYLDGGATPTIDATNIKFYSKRRKFNLPEAISWDTRNTVLNNQVWFNAVLIKNGKHTSTKTKTVLKAMQEIAKNREEEHIWNHNEVTTYLNQYNTSLETGWTVELAKYLAKSGPRTPNNKTKKETIVKEVVKDITDTKTNKIISTIHTKRKRIYNLPKYICYDKAESRNRERNVFQTQLNIHGKLIKNNLYSVHEAVIYVASKMLEHTDIWSLDKIADYLKTYNPEMENGNFVPSDTPKSPSWRKREKKKNIQSIKEQINSKLAEILKFAKNNDINIDVNVN